MVEKNSLKIKKKFDNLSFSLFNLLIYFIKFYDNSMKDDWILDIFLQKTKRE